MSWEHLPAHSRNPWHHNTYGDYITAHHRWPAIFSILSVNAPNMESAMCLILRLCAGQSHGTFPPWAAQPNTCRAQHSGYLTCASRTGWLACAVGDVHSPLRRGSPVCCVMRKAWGPVWVLDLALCLWGDPPAHPKNNAWDRGQQPQLQVRTKTIRFNIVFQKTRSWFLNNCNFLSFPKALHAF